MSEFFDLVIYARGLNAALLYAEAANKGLNVALVLENDCNNLETSPFILTHFYKGKPFLAYTRATKNSEKLKKAAANLVVQSQVIHCKSTSLVEKIFFRIFNLFRKTKIKTFRSKRSRCLEYTSFKFSADRMAIELLKSGSEKGGEVFQFCSLISSQYIDNQYYKINLFDKSSGNDLSLKTKAFLVNPLANRDVLDKNRNPDENNTAFYFTYPADQTKLTDVVIFDRANVQILVVPWFGLVYFKLSGAGDMDVKKAIKLVQRHLDFINLDEKHIGAYGKKDRSFFIKEHVGHLILYFKNNQYFYPFPSIDSHFCKSERIILKILKHLNRKSKSVSILKNTILPTSDLGIVYHPLRIMELADEKYDMAKQINPSPQHFKKLFYRYGAHIDVITDKAFDYYNQNKDNKKAWLMAEIWYCKYHEMCRTYESFINTYTNLWMDPENSDKEFIRMIFNEI